ncbi:MAG: DNA-protecting protein DprA [Chlorobiota bacterium]|nr:MAG: DNA-protecting protein DprA [Chlorobiota bacterium]
MLKNIVETGVSIEEILTATTKDLSEIGLKSSSIKSIHKFNYFLDLANIQFEIAQKNNYKIINFWDEDYPFLLREIYSSPMNLFVFGNLITNENCISIVGTRNNTQYGRLIAEKYAEEFVLSKITVVSGLARGIDTYSHKSALKNNGRTIAVIASGLDEINSEYIEKIVNEISESGAVISEYPFGTKAIPAFFPQRNRIIAGISKGLVIVESDIRGGSLITAQFALDQNREVFSVPGNINSQKSKGTNELIRNESAKLTLNPRDVLVALGFNFDIIEETKTKIIDHSSLTFFEKQVLDNLNYEPKHIDSILSNLNMTSSELLINLLTLEFKGLVRQLAGKMFLVK